MYFFKNQKMFYFLLDYIFSLLIVFNHVDFMNDFS